MVDTLPALGEKVESGWVPNHGGSEGLHAFESPPDEANVGEVPELEQDCGWEGRFNSRVARPERIREINGEVDKLLQGWGGRGPSPRKRRSAMEEGVAREGEYFLGNAPVIEEAKEKTLSLGDFGLVVDPWGGELKRQAEARAVRWRAESMAHKLNQEKQRSEVGKKLAARAGATKAGVFGGVSLVERKAPCVLSHVPAPPSLDEDKASEEAADHGSRLVEHDEQSVAKAVEDEPTEAAWGRRASSGTRRRKRGRRGRGKGVGGDDERGEVEVWCLNSSGAPQLRAALNHATNVKGCGPVALLNQESHACVDRLPDLQAQARELGWRVVPAPAVKTVGRGRSAGVGVCTPTHVAAGRRDGEDWDWSTPESPGRAVATWVQGVLPCGVYMASCYLHDTEGGTSRNLQLLAGLLGRLRATRCPWVVGLDAQQEPAEFVKWAGPLLEKVGGRVVASGSPTFFYGVGCSKEIDFFIVDEALVASIRKIGTLSEFRCRSKDSGYTVCPGPHRLVWVSFASRCAVQLKQVLRTPRGFDRKKPCGCARAPCAPQELRPAIAALAGSGSIEEKVKVARDAWAEAVTCVEAELCGVLDKVGAGAQQQKWCGRGQGASIVARLVFPNRAGGIWGRMSQDDYGNVWLLNRCKELLCIAVKEERGGLGCECRMEQWVQLVRKVCSPSAPTALRGEAKMEGLINELQRCLLCPGDAVAALVMQVNWLKALVQRALKARERASKVSWEIWKRQQERDGGEGGMLFKFVKRTREDPEVATRCLNAPSLLVQDVIAADFEQWNALWQKLKDVAHAPWRSVQGVSGSIGPPLRVLDHTCMRKAARTFKIRTATGVDQLSPSHFTWLSDVLLQRLAELLMWLEEAGIWPSQLEESLVHLIPKTSGGRRPVGLLPALVRLWERARRADVDEWRARVGRDYDWMGKGKGAEKSVWAQAVYEEAARARGDATAGVLVDLVKAFEQVALNLVWEQGRSMGFPVRILVLTLESCAFARRLTYRGAVSGTAKTLSAVLVGGGFATDLLFVTLVKGVDEIMLRHERAGMKCGLRSFMVVDDIRFVLEGRKHRVLGGVTRVVENIMDVFEGQLSMEVSRDKDGVEGKTVAQASEKDLRRKVGLFVGKYGIRVKKKVKNLGVDFDVGGVGAAMGRVALRGRVREGVRRLKRAVCVGSVGRRRVVRSMIVPSVVYGSAAQSLPRSDVRFLRTELAKTFGPIAGRSTTVRLVVEGIDLAALIVEKAVMTWVRGLWDGLVEYSAMHQAWRAECSIRAGGLKGSNSRLGGAAALFDALETLGWAAPAADVLKSRDGILMCFGPRREVAGGFEVAPALIWRMLRDDLEQVALADSQLARDFDDIRGEQGYARSPATREGRREEFEGGAFGDVMGEELRRAAGLWRRGKFKTDKGHIVPWIWPIASIVKAARRKGWEKAAASLRSLAEGGWPIQHKLWLEGKAAHNICRCREAAGTVWHKLTACRLSKEHREACCEEEDRKEWAAFTWNPMYSRGVPPRPKDPPLVPAHTWHEVSKEGVEKVATGRVYSDGSARGCFWRARRAGWAFVVLDEDGKWKWTAKGTVDGPDCSSFRAELKALLEVLRVAVPPLKIFIDNKGVVDGIANGESWCTNSRSACADLWRQVWVHWKELEGQGVQVIKVKAHTSWWDVLSGVIPHIDHVGNAMADRAAKQATEAAESLAPTGYFVKQLRGALRWLKWVLMYTFEWAGDTEADNAHELEGVGQRRRGGMGVENRVRYEVLRHELWRVKGSFVCRRCGGKWKDEGADVVEALQEKKCSGCAAGRAAAHATGNINYLWTVCARDKEELRGEGGRLISPSAPPGWMVDASRINETIDSVSQRREVLRLAGLNLSVFSDQEQHPSSVAEVGTGVEEEEELMPWMRAPQWLPTWMQQPFEKSGPRGTFADAEGDERRWRRKVGQPRRAVRRSQKDHVIVVRGAIAFCARCAQFALNRLGRGLKGPCAAPQNRRANAVHARLVRLRKGCHPITGQPVDTQ